MNNPIMYADPNGCDPWSDFWNGVGSFFTGLVKPITDTFNPGNPIFGPLISVLEITAGVMLVASGCGVTIGLGLIGVGFGSLISAEVNAANGGSYLAGWVGGQVGGLISMIPIPGLTGAAGGFLGSMVTDWMDKGWNGIAWEKAGVTAAFSGAFHLVTGMIGIEIGNSLIPNIVTATRGLLTDIIVGLFNSLYKSNDKKERIRGYIGSK